MSQQDKAVLLIDDSPEDREYLRRCLGQDPGTRYRIQSVSTIDEALRACRTGPFDCLILDYDLPDGSGLDLLDALAGTEGQLDVAVVVLTGKGSEQLAVQALKRGVQDYLVKGQFSPTYLCQTVGDAISKVMLRAELERQRHEAARLGEEARRRAEELADAGRRKDEFLAMLGHELRNPLAPLRTGLDVLGRLDVTGTDHARTRAIMSRQLDHMVRLVDDLLDVSRMTRGKVELRLRSVELGEAVARAVEGVRGRLEERGHQLDVVLPESAVGLEADPDRLEQVFGNLLTNAGRYTEPGGHIQVFVGLEAGEATVRVRDDGIGIRADMLDRIFEPFTQADRVTGRVSEGLGLGLALVRGLVELHGGRVAVHSDGPGHGSEFVVRLPVVPLVEPSEDGSEDVCSLVVRPLRILVVDDNVDAALMLANLLRLDGGHEVRVAHDGASALIEAGPFLPEVALLDIALPDGMSGYEVAEQLRAMDGLAGTVLVAVTGFGGDREREQSRQAGLDAHLVKPVDLLLLRELLAQVSAECRVARVDPDGF